MAAPAPSLAALLAEGFHLLCLVRAGWRPTDPAALAQGVDRMLAGFEGRAAALGKPAPAVLEAKYAFCALADELIQGAQGAQSADPAQGVAWSHAPLQHRHFGEHLAGEGFFRRLERERARLRQDPGGGTEALEVFLACLLLGFRGRYLPEEEDRLRLLVRALGEELDQARGGRPPFAPQWLPVRPAANPAPVPRPASVYLLAAGLAAATLALVYRVALHSAVGVLAGGR
jgi:type VI secretion system protein ImpK